MCGTRISGLLGRTTITILVMVGLCVNTAVALDGSGTEQDPWRIESLTDFNEFAADANYWDDYTRLETDVNLAGLTYSTAVIAPDTNGCVYEFDGTAFTGAFDGNGHKITGLTIDDAGASKGFLGLFGCIGRDGQVSNLSLEGGSVSGGYYVGGLVGLNWFASVLKCYSTGDVNGVEYVGGLVGENHDGRVFNCCSTGEVSGNNEVGGLVGYNRFGSVSNCYSTGDVNGVGEVGGLVGANYSDGSVSNCYSTGEVSGSWSVSGLVGFNDGSISNCYSTGDVSGNDCVGGLVGENWSSVSNCFWDTETQTHGVTESFGVNIGTVTNVEGLPTTEMQTESTFTDAGWDFEEIWNIGENQTYPYLRVHPTGDINHDDIVNMLDFAIFADHWLEGKGN